MPPLLRLTPSPADRHHWWVVFALVSLAAGIWAVATPLFTGPDEVSQARRAAAVVRGQLTGRTEGPGPAILVTVDVPTLYGDPAEQQWLCHLGPLVDGAPQEPMTLARPPCPDLSDMPSRLVAADTVQYRGQPFFYALAGLPTLVTSQMPGAYAMRLVGVAVTAALVASAAATVTSGRNRPLAGLGVATALTPGLFHLAGATNPSAVEIAAALCAWAAVGRLAVTDWDPGSPEVAAVIRRLGVSLTVLTVTRGLGPLFAAAIVTVGLQGLGWQRSRVLAGRSDVRRWTVAVVIGTAASGLWLAHITNRFPLPDRPGSGFLRAFGWLPWYLRQSVGVFGTNDSAVTPLAAWVWVGLFAAVLGVGLARLYRSGQHRLGAMAVLVTVGGLILNVTAEGLSLPPIGFFWQGRYAVPLLVGGVVLAVSTPASDPTAVEPTAREHLRLTGFIVAALGLAAVHVHGLAAVIDHQAALSGRTAWAVLGVYGLVVLALLGELGHSREPRRTCRVGAPAGAPVQDPSG